MSTNPDLSRLLRPRSVVVMGGGWAANVVEQLGRAGFDGAVWPVHPRREAIHGIPAFRSLADLPAAPDAAWIGVNRDATVEAVRTLSGMGAGGAVAFASGFRESGDGVAREAALLAAAGAMPVIGPNCYGLVNYLDGATLWPDQHGGRQVERGVAILTQSSNVAINLTMQGRGLPLAYALTAGNQAQLGLADLAAAVLADERVTAIGLHVEGVGDLRAFEALALAARARRVPIVAIKVGASEQSRAATVSHTASLTGTEAGSRAFFARLGIPLLESLPAFLETLKLLHVHGSLAGRRLLSMSCSGGEASLVADAGARRGLDFPAFAEAERDAVRATLNPLVAVANPLDYHTFSWGDRAAMQATFEAAMRPGFDLSMLVLDFPRGDRCSQATWEPAVEAIGTASRLGPTAVVATLPELMPEARAEAFVADGVAPLCGLEEALAAADASAKVGAAWARAAPAPVLDPAPSAGEARLLGEFAAKRLLGAAGVPIPEGQRTLDAERAVEAAEAIGYPVALKALGLAHKTEAGGVLLGLGDAQAVRVGAERLLRLSDALLVERMVEGAVAELIVGIARDPAYGLLLTLGSGGVLAELVQDTATLMLPATEAEIGAALDGLRVARLLDGWRGGPRGDREAALAAIDAVARFAVDKAPALEELDVNPLIVCERGAWAADALLRLRWEVGQS